MNYQDKNIQALLANQKMMMERIQTLEKKTTVLENNLTNARVELQNAKQTMAHVSGRGMGSTVHVETE